MAKERYDLDGSDVVLDGLYKNVPTTTHFFRYPNLDSLAKIGAGLPADETGKLWVAEPACSTGKETWSLASLMATHGLNFHIDAMDINPVVLEAAHRPYQIGEDTTRILGQQSIRQYFDVTDDEINPRPELRERVSFNTHDLAADSLEYRKYGAVVVNTLMTHFWGHEEVIADMVANIADGLKPGGVLVTSSGSYIPKRTLADNHFKRLRHAVGVGRRQRGKSHKLNGFFRFEPPAGSEA